MSVAEGRFFAHTLITRVFRCQNQNIITGHLAVEGTIKFNTLWFIDTHLNPRTPVLFPFQTHRNVAAMGRNSNVQRFSILFQLYCAFCHWCSWTPPIEGSFLSIAEFAASSWSGHDLTRHNDASEMIFSCEDVHRSVAFIAMQALPLPFPLSRCITLLFLIALGFLASHYTLSSGLASTTGII